MVQPDSVLHVTRSKRIKILRKIKKDFLRLQSFLRMPSILQLTIDSRVTAVFCVNADGTHALPLRYIGKSMNPKCFNDPRFSHHREFYSSQAKGWMDTDGFLKWIRWWYKEACDRNSGHKLLIKDYCSGHIVEENLADLRIITLPPSCTAKHRPQDLGLIGSSKIRYRSLLLRATISIMETKSKGTIQFREDSVRGRYGIPDGHFPNVGDAMDLFNEAWRMTSTKGVIKCWVKSECLSENRCIEATELLSQLDHMDEPLMQLTSQPLVELNRNQVIDENTCRSILRDLQDVAADSDRVADAALQEALQEVRDLCEIYGLMAVVNSPALFDDDPSRSEIANRLLQSMFDENNGRMSVEDNYAISESQE